MLERGKTLVRQKWKRVATALLGYVFFYYTIYAYTDWFSGMKLSSRQPLELMIIIYLFFVCQGLFKDRRYKVVLSTLPVLTLYVVHDVLLGIYGRVPRLVEVKELPELVQATDASMLAMFGLPALLITGFLLINIDRKKYREFLFRCVPLAILVVVMVFQPGLVTGSIKKFGRVYRWSEIRSTQKTGRITMALYHEANRRQNKSRLASFRNPDKLSVKISDKVLKAIKPRDVHVLVLESFVDPLLFKNLSFSASPTPEAFDKLVGDGITLSESPIFGGGTARAEFEVLCGVPSFGSVDGIEYNVFSGAKTYCLPEILNRAGFRTVASIATSPKYYNSKLAYEGMGFQELYFPKELVPQSDTYLVLDDTVGEKDHLFDGSLFEQDLDFISSTRQDGRPVLNYVLGMYGHHYFYRNEQKRPTVVTTNSGVDEIDRLVNQYYYRTQALADFISSIDQDGREHIVVVVSDHLPPLVKGLRGKDLYDKLGYLDNIPGAKFLNQAIIVKDGRVVKYKKMQHFNLYRVILDYLSDGEYCREQACDFDSPDRDRYQDDYMTILGLASR